MRPHQRNCCSITSPLESVCVQERMLMVWRWQQSLTVRMLDGSRGLPGGKWKMQGDRSLVISGTCEKLFCRRVLFSPKISNQMGRWWKMKWAA